MPSLAWVSQVRQDVSFAARQLRRFPGFTASAVASLAAGVWLAAIVSAVVVPSVWPTVPYPNARDLVQVGEVGLIPESATLAFGAPTVSRSVAGALRAGPWFAALGEYHARMLAELSNDDRTVREASAVSHEMFAVLGVAPLIGRPFLEEEDMGGEGNSVILSYDFWQSRFGGDRAVLGATLGQKAGPALRIVGVMPAGFAFPPGERPDLYVPMGCGLAGCSGSLLSSVIGRPRAGVAVAQVQAAALVIARRYAETDEAEVRREWPSIASGMRGGAQRVSVVASRYAGGPMVSGEAADDTAFGVAGLFVLLIACANLASLMLIRAASRRVELAVRMALGASRRRVLTQLMTETGLLIVPGSLAGVGLAWLHLHAVAALTLDLRTRPALDIRAASIAIAAAALVAVVFAFMAARRAAAANFGHALREQGGAVMGASRMDGVMNRLVTLSLALTVALVVGATLSAGFVLGHIYGSPGYSVDHVAVANLSVSETDHPTTDRVVTAEAAALADAQGMAGAAAAAIGPAPTRRLRSTIRVVHADHTTVALGNGFFSSISPEFFRTLGIPLIAGRTFSAAESQSGAPVAIVGAATAAELWPDQPAVGRHVLFQIDRDTAAGDYEIVGVVGDLAGAATGTFAPEVYVPYGTRPDRRTSLIVRGSGDPSARAMTLTRLIGQRPGVSATGAASLESIVAAANRQDAYLAQLTGVFGLAALILAAVGLYGVVGFAAAQRTHEIGVRLALGATPGNVIRMIILHSAKVSATGMSAGLFLAILLGLVLRSRLWGMERLGPALFVAALALVGSILFLATFIPALRASRLDPLKALRAE